jgi:aspartate aminotransferase
MQTSNHIEPTTFEVAPFSASPDARERPVVAGPILQHYHSGASIRKMFDEGLRLKEMFGSHNVADLSLGNPCFAPPAAFSKALRDVAATPGRHAYMPNAGFPEVRDRIAEALNRDGYFSEIEGRHVVMTTGAAGAINVVLKTILEPGDEVIVPRPYFTEYGYYIANHGGRMVLVATSTDFDLDVEAILDAVTERTRAVIINSPCNPSGRVFPEPTLRMLADGLTERSRQIGSPIFVISDEPYREILFDDARFTSIASLYPNSFMCYSWSKSYSISGERIGYVAVNPALDTDDWPALLGSLAMCNRFLGFVNAPAFMQRVIGESLDALLNLERYTHNRMVLCAALEEGGYSFQSPEGTFYVFPQTPYPEDEFVRRAKDQLLLVVPGSVFGAADHFRISFAATDRSVDLACERLIRLAR